MVVVMNQREKKIIQALIENPDGLTVQELREVTGAVSQRQIEYSISCVYGLYIDRWKKNAKGHWVAVYCLADVPEDCPKP